MGTGDNNNPIGDFPSHAHVKNAFTASTTYDSNLRIMDELEKEKKKHKSFVNKVIRIFKIKGICKSCPDNCKAITSGKKCCLELEDERE